MKTLYLLAFVLVAAVVICDGRPGRSSGRRRGSGRAVVKLEDCFDKKHIEDEVKKVENCNHEERGRSRGHRRRGRDVEDDVVEGVEDDVVEEEDLERHGSRYGEGGGRSRAARRKWSRSNRKLGRDIRCLITNSNDTKSDGKLDVKDMKTKLAELAKPEKSDALSGAFDKCSEGKVDVKSRHEAKSLIRCVWKAAAVKICPFKHNN